jgi:hypothetical protein
MLIADTTTSGYIVQMRGIEVEAAIQAKYDNAFNGGYSTAGAAANLVVQSYGELVIAQDGSFVGESGYIDTAPTGSAVIVDIEKNGTSIYTTPPQFAAGSNTMTAGTLKVDGTEDFVDGDRISFKVTQIGSTTPGQGVRFTVKGLLA